MTQPVNRSMPSSIVIPVLGYADVRAAVDWLCRAFGFAERLKIGDHRSQLECEEGGAVVVTGLRADSNVAASGATHSIMIRVADVIAHYERARQCGATIAGPPADYPYGERQYSAIDPGGHVWTFSQTVEDVDPVRWGGELFESR